MWMRASYGLSALMVVGCTSTPTPTPPTPKESATNTANSTPAPVGRSTGDATSTSLAPGRYCYSLDNDNSTGALRLTVADDNQVSGDGRFTIHNEASSYYSSYGQKLTGEIAGDQANLDITTWIEYDQQQASETWTVSETELDTGREVLSAADCDSVQPLFAGEDGLEAADILGEPSNQSIQKVQFAQGNSGTKIDGAVVRGARNVYVVGASGGQTMTVAISAVEDNAVIDVISPSGLILLRESIGEAINLPETGDYQIVVSGTRGNATFSLAIEIE